MFLQSAVALLATAFWIWMLVVAVTRERGTERIVWVIVIVFTSVIGALIYFFVRHAPRTRSA